MLHRHPKTSTAKTPKAREDIHGSVTCVEARGHVHCAPMSTIPWRAPLAIAALGVTFGCSSDRPKEPQVQDGTAELALRTVKSVGRFSSALGRARVATRDGAGWRVAPSPDAHTRTLGAVFPVTAGRPMRVFDAADPEGIWVEVRPLGINDAKAQVHEGHATVMRDVAVETDVVHFATETMAEELRVLRSPGASPKARYEVVVGPRVASARLRDGAIELADGTGFVRLSTLPAIAIDAKGTERALALTFAETGDKTFSLETSLDPSGLAYPIVVDPAWTSAATMKSYHQRHVLVTMTDGRALAATNGGAYVSTSSETYSPTTNVWTSTASLPQPFERGCDGVGFTAGSRSGFVLIIGNGFSNDAGALYSPGANTWTATPIPTPALDNVSLVLLADGFRALAVPGTSTSARLFNSTSGTAGGWTAAGTMGNIRLGHGAARLSDGRVLVTGGKNGTTVLATAEIYNPATNTWSATTSMPGARWGHSATLVGTKVLVAGGSSAATANSTKTAWLFDPATSAWTTVGSLSVARTGHVAVLTSTGKVLVAGSDGGVDTDTAEVFDPAAAVFRAAGSLSELRPGGRGTLISTGVLVTGGDDPFTSSPSKAAEIWAPGALGVACGIGDDCESGFCINGVCCSTSSCASGQRCDFAPKKGTCTFPQGSSCATAAQCSTNLCVDGRCCDTTCGAQCEACNVAGKEGTCSAVIGAPVGVRTACAGSTSTDPCAKQYCDGSDRNKCYYPSAGLVDCGANACTAGMESHLAKCNGAGACGDVPTSCGAYTCGPTRCQKSCKANADCVSGRYCDTTRGECVPYETLGRKCSDVVPCGTGLFCTNGFCCGTAKCADGASCGVPGKEGTCTRVNGSACTADAECGSGFCVDGVCCDRACGGQCEACDVFDPTTGLAGKCIPVKGVPHGKRTACDASTDVCGTKQCDGTTVDSCKSLVGSDVVCRTQSCVAGTQTLEAKCDGAGACPTVVTKSCAGYACTLDGLGCETTCTTNDQCATGYRCQSGSCVEPTDRCSDDRRTSIAKSGAETPCAPYSCRTDGRCGSNCTTTNDCSPGNICAEGVCAPTPTQAVEDGGGCSMGARSSRSGSAFAVFAIALGALLRRRRAVSLASLAMLTFGCSTKSTSSTPEPNVAPSRDAAPIVQELRGFGDLAAGIDTSHAIVRSGAGFAVADAFPNEKHALAANMPARSDGPVRLVSARDPDAWAEIRATDLAAAEGVASEGAVVYAGATEDVLLLPSPGRLEEVRIVRRAAPVHVATYSLRVGPSVATVRLRAGHVEVVDAKGYVHFATEPMYAVDANGTRRKVTATVAQDGDGFRLETRLDAASLAYPIAIDPAWNAVASMNNERGQHKTVQLADGRVLAIGGEQLGVEIKLVEIYNPVTNTWTDAAPMAKNRWGFAAERLTSGTRSGQVIVLGGHNGGDITVQSATEIYNPTTNTWSAGPTLKAGRTSPASALIGGGSKIFVTSGSTGEVYDSATGTTTSATNAMSASRTDPDGILLPTGNVLVFGGSVGSGASASAHLYRPATNDFAITTTMPSARRQALFALVGSKLLVAGGNDGTNPLSSAVVFDPATATWATTGAMSVTRDGGRGASLLSGRAIAVGGNLTTNTEIYNPIAGTWSLSGFYSRQRGSFELLGLTDGSVLMTGGNGSGKTLANVDKFAPSALGNACTAGNDCLSGYCTNGVCCSTATCSVGATCNRPKTLGTCSKSLGTTCGGATECESGFCVDGVCCNVACGGQCQSCSVTGKVGTCVAVSGTPLGGRTACPTGATDPCAAQTCDGYDGTKCHYLPAGKTACGATACTAGVSTSAGTCNGAGTCNDVSKSCGAYACAGTKCATTCASSTECAAGFYCDTKTSTCVVNEGLGQKCSTTAPCKTGLSCVDGYCCGVASCGAGSTCGWFGREGTCTKVNGSTCAADAECGSSHCIDGVCCDSVCNGQCEACDIVEAATGRAGRCLPVVGAPHGTRTACSSDPGNECSGSQCGGEQRDKCNVFVGSWRPCRKQTCQEGVVTLPAQCDGKGACPAVVTATCEAYTCSDDGARCRTSCAKESDCASGFYCQVDKCVKRAAACSQDNASSIPNGGTAVPCAPYRCVESGACGSSCHTSDECAAGFVCDPSGTCVAPPAAGDEGGCAYGASSHGRRAGAGLLLVAMAISAVTRRRRRD